MTLTTQQQTAWRGLAAALVVVALALALALLGGCKAMQYGKAGVVPEIIHAQTPGAAGGFNPANGIFSSARVYTRALSAGEVAADAAGTVQTGCLLDIDFTTQAKLAATFAAPTDGGITTADAQPVI